MSMNKVRVARSMKLFSFRERSWEATGQLVRSMSAWMRWLSWQSADSDLGSRMLKEGGAYLSRVREDWNHASLEMGLGLEKKLKKSNFYVILFIKV